MKIFYATLVLLYAIFFWWYGGSGEPVTAEELEGYIAELRANSDPSAKDLEKNIQYMRNLVASDTGDEFLMVNLMNYREKALYPPGSPWSDDPDALAADARYAEKIVPLLLKRASHPVFVAPISGVFIIEGVWGNWDSVAVIRYRSARDMLEMIVEMSELDDVVVHKWASMEQTQVFPATATLSVVNMRLMVALLLISLAVVVRGIVGLTSKS